MPGAFGVVTIGRRRATIVWVPHSAIADPNDPPAGVYGLRSGDSLILIQVFPVASQRRVLNVQGVHPKVVVLWHLGEDMNEQLVDQYVPKECNHDPLQFALPFHHDQASYDSGKAVPSKYQVTVCVMTHASLVVNNGRALYTMG